MHKRKTLTIFWPGLVIIATLLQPFLAATQARAWEGVVVKVLDGDSLRVRRDGRLYELRLYGIDAPEHRQPHGDRSRRFSQDLLDRQPVTVEEKDVDRYGRIVALVTCRGRLVNQELVREGLAWHYSRYCHTQPLCGELATLENEARTARRGLWAEPAPVPPWEWKRRAKSDSGERPAWRRWLDSLW